jgi:hypothetical protein
VELDGRTVSGGYRYGFQSQEVDNDIQGIGNSYTAEFWQFDPRLGRRWNIDPVLKASYSHYIVLGDNPIRYIDPRGDDWFVNKQGFYIESDDSYVPGFEYAGTEKPQVSSYRILTYVQGDLYHKYTGNVFSSAANYMFGTDWVEKKIYSPSEENFNEMVLFTAEMVLSGAAIKKIGAAFIAYKNVGSSIWKMASFTDRGFVYEAMKGGNLVKNFPIIDKFSRGIATSIKTLDLGAKTYKSGGKAVFNTLKKYVDKLDEFAGATKGGTTVAKDEIKKKVLDVGIPRGATTEQVKQMQQAVSYAKNKGIDLKLIVVK